LHLYNLFVTFVHLFRLYPATNNLIVSFYVRLLK